MKKETVINVFKAAAAFGLAASMALTGVSHAQSIEKLTDGKGKPKYVFVFVGDGMSYPQIQSAAYFIGKDALGTVAETKKSGDSKDSPISGSLSFFEFPVVGTAQTYDATSFAPDSASTATSIFTGHKTHSGSIGVDITKKVRYETIAEQLRARKNWKIGVISSVNINHATPAATYAHVASRKSNYEIGKQLVESDFDYFAGGALMDPEDKKKDKESIYSLAEKAGYSIRRKLFTLTAVKNAQPKPYECTCLL